MSESRAGKAERRFPVARADEIPEGGRKIVTVNGMELGIFRVRGEFYAYRNVCPHAGAPVCAGKICGTTLAGAVGEYTLAREGEILRCPWHGWEFDLLTGRHLVDEKMKLRSYSVDQAPDATETPADEDLTPFAVVNEEQMLYIVLP